ncbi:MAG: hypothetical protein IBX72_03170 [Nitrospirae bacterium]|jgi:hypothetical protein|nr:hypothetical protein [Nitrospirota bacterium]
MSIQPKGEDLRKAVRWISDELQSGTDVKLSSLIEEACIKFNISPADSEFLFNFFSEKDKKES